MKVLIRGRGIRVSWIVWLERVGWIEWLERVSVVGVKRLMGRSGLNFLGF